MKMKTGSRLAKFYKLNVSDAYVHREGRWYHPLKRFPGVYFDSEGCVIFENQEDYSRCSDFRASNKTSDSDSTIRL
jgi:hypothetical protein